MRKHLGFTGTQQGMTSEQKEILATLMGHYRSMGYDFFHHGDCIGADAEAAEIADSLDFYIHVWPCSIEAKRAYIKPKAGTIHEVKHPLTRNQDIVNWSDALIVAPKTDFEIIRSGTWSTYRKMKAAKKERVIIYPSGSLQSEDK